ncbi:MAG: hypothetical protein QM764_03785 [Chitinophagaceae bacterium]
MRNLLILLFMIIACSDCMAQYTVTKVIGVVKNKGTGEILKTGSKLTDEDMLIFSTPNDIVRVIVAGKGVYVISPATRTQEQSSEIVEMLRTALHVKFKEGYLSGRSLEDELIPGILETITTMNNNNLFKEINKYLFDGDKFNASKGRFFLQIESPGTQAIIHPLLTNADTLVIYASDFSTGNKIDPEKTTYKLGFFSKEKNSSESLALIKPYIDSTDEMEAIIKIMMQENKQADKTKMEQTCYSEVYASLGKPSGILFKQIFDKLYTKRQK